MYRPFYYQELFSIWNYCKTNEILKDGERLPPQCSIQSWASPLKVPVQTLPAPFPTHLPTDMGKAAQTD